jgi:uncharacterized protein (TIGR02145 family)
MKKVLLCAAFIAASFTSIAQVGVGTTMPDASAALDITSTKAGLLPPRMTTAERDVINSGVWAEGLTIYNTDTKCLELYNGTDWISVCDGSVVTTPSNGTIPDNATCTSATISTSPCTAGELASGINGGSLGNKYDNNNGGTYSVVEIGGQCWMQESIDVNPAGSPTWVNSSDVGWYGYYNDNYQAAGEGTLLQWSAAMNGATTERAQGVCPTDWHIPSDCEWMYLENSLGMNTADQELTGVRNSGTVGSKLSTLTDNGNGTNSSGFTGLLPGYRATLGSFVYRGNYGYWWSSSETSAPNAHFRRLGSSQAGVHRRSFNKALGFSVRCLKD